MCHVTNLRSPLLPIGGFGARGGGGGGRVLNIFLDGGVLLGLWNPLSKTRQRSDHITTLF